MPAVTTSRRRRVGTETVAAATKAAPPTAGSFISGGSKGQLHPAAVSTIALAAHSNPSFRALIVLFVWLLMAICRFVLLADRSLPIEAAMPVLATACFLCMDTTNFFGPVRPSFLVDTAIVSLLSFVVMDVAVAEVLLNVLLIVDAIQWIRLRFAVGVFGVLTYVAYYGALGINAEPRSLIFRLMTHYAFGFCGAVFLSANRLALPFRTMFYNSVRGWADDAAARCQASPVLSAVGAAAATTLAAPVRVVVQLCTSRWTLAFLAWAALITVDWFEKISIGGLMMTTSFVSVGFAATIATKDRRTAQRYFSQSLFVSAVWACDVFIFFLTPTKTLPFIANSVIAAFVVLYYSAPASNRPKLAPGPSQTIELVPIVPANTSLAMPVLMWMAMVLVDLHVQVSNDWEAPSLGRTVLSVNTIGYGTLMLMSTFMDAIAKESRAAGRFSLLHDESANTGDLPALVDAVAVQQLADDVDPQELATTLSAVGVDFENLPRAGRLVAATPSEADEETRPAGEVTGGETTAVAPAAEKKMPRVVSTGDVSLATTDDVSSVLSTSEAPESPPARSDTEMIEAAALAEAKRQEEAAAAASDHDGAKQQQRDANRRSNERSDVGEAERKAREKAGAAERARRDELRGYQERDLVKAKEVDKKHAKVKAAADAKSAADKSAADKVARDADKAAKEKAKADKKEAQRLLELQQAAAKQQLLQQQAAAKKEQLARQAAKEREQQLAKQAAAKEQQAAKAAGKAQVKQQPATAAAAKVVARKPAGPAVPQPKSAAGPASRGWETAKSGASSSANDSTEPSPSHGAAAAAAAPKKAEDDNDARIGRLLASLSGGSNMDEPRHDGDFDLKGLAALCTNDAVVPAAAGGPRGDDDDEDWNFINDQMRTVIAEAPTTDDATVMATRPSMATTFKVESAGEPVPELSPLEQQHLLQQQYQQQQQHAALLQYHQQQQQQQQQQYYAAQQQQQPVYYQQQTAAGQPVNVVYMVQPAAAAAPAQSHPDYAAHQAAVAQQQQQQQQLYYQQQVPPPQYAYSTPPSPQHQPPSPPHHSQPRPEHSPHA
jgi:hypothetical protein